MKSKKIKMLSKILPVLIIVGALGYGGFRISQYRKATKDLGSQLNAKTEELNKLKTALVANPAETVQKVQAEENKVTLEAVSKLYTLPENETPTIASVQDKSKLADQPFFKDAENGDMLIVYEKSGIAVLYRPSTNKLVKVGPLNVQTSTPETPAATPAPAQ